MPVKRTKSIWPLISTTPKEKEPKAKKTQQDYLNEREDRLTPLAQAERDRDEHDKYMFPESLAALLMESEGHVETGSEDTHKQDKYTDPESLAGLLMESEGNVGTGSVKSEDRPVPLEQAQKDKHQQSNVKYGSVKSEDRPAPLQQTPKDKHKQSNVGTGSVGSEDRLTPLPKAKKDKDKQSNVGSGTGTKPVKSEDRLAPLTQAQKNKDTQGNIATGSVKSDEWIKILAVHLAAEPDFAKWMQNPQTVESILLRKEWLAAVYLPGRSKYNRFENWYGQWLSRDRKTAVLQMAKDMYERQMPTVQTTIKNTIVEKPDNSLDSQRKREDLFKVNSTRQKLTMLIKSCTDTEFALSTRSRALLTQPDMSRPSEEMLAVLEEVQELERCKEDCRRKLGDSMLVKAGVAMLDKLLELADVQADTVLGTLYALPEAYLFKIEEPSEGDADQVSVTDKQRAGEDDDEQVVPIGPAIAQSEDVKIDFLDGRALGDTSTVFTLRTPTAKDLKGLEQANLTGSTIVGWQKLQALDGNCAKWLDEVSGKINNVSFVLTFKEFEKAVTRPEDCQNAKRDAKMWISPRCWLIVMKDNIVHIRRIVHALVANKMIISEDGKDSLAELQAKLRRMWALLALAFGNWSEPALLCSVMDWLLEDLASLLIGHVDPAFETGRMRVMLDSLAVMSQPEKAGLKPKGPNPKVLEKEHKARTLFAELARFFRGAVMMGVAATSPKSGVSNKNEHKIWYEKLLEWSSHCGHSACKEQLKVIVNTELKTQQFSLSVAVADERIGYPEERAFISENRAFAYSCFYHFLVAVRYHAGLGPFFHYFAHLWHPACRPFRGKQSLIEDLDLLELRVHDSQSQ